MEESRTLFLCAFIVFILIAIVSFIGQFERFRVSARILKTIIIMFGWSSLFVIFLASLAIASELLYNPEGVKFLLFKEIGPRILGIIFFNVIYVVEFGVLASDYMDDL